jgi:alkyl hydroperoxide reductase subunit AhpC
MVNNLLCDRSVSELLRILKLIQYINENPSHACPADWKYGDQTLYSHPLKSKVYFKIFYSNKKS